jgi:hypothetical protein
MVVTEQPFLSERGRSVETQQKNDGVKDDGVCVCVCVCACVRMRA